MEVLQEHIVNKLKQQFKDAISETSEVSGMLEIVVAAPQVLEIMTFLYQQEDLGFQFLTDVTGIHYPDNSGKELCAVYHLHNLRANKRLRLKAYMPISAPNVPSVTSLYSSANWMERETYDFFGINFEGHPNLKRILNADEMDYFPMRKEYPMEDPTRVDKDDEMFGR